MTQKNKALSRFFVDVSSLIAGLVVGMLCLYFFRGGVTLPLDSTDSLILISTVFAALFLSSVLHKAIKA